MTETILSIKLQLRKSRFGWLLASLFSDVAQDAGRDNLGGSVEKMLVVTATTKC